MQILQQNPIRGWISEVIKLSRQKGYDDKQIKHWIKEYAIDNGYSERQINRMLRDHGIGIYRTRPVIYRRYPKLTFCPKCSEIGKINVFYPNNKLAYIIVHEQIPGQWGKSKTVPRHRRCYTCTKEHIERLTQELEFYNRRDRSDLEQEIKK